MEELTEVKSTWKYEDKSAKMTQTGLAFQEAPQ